MAKWKLLPKIFCFLLIIGCPIIVNADEKNSWTLLESSSDEFEGNILDESKWKKGLWYDVSSDFAFKESNVEVRNGHLILQAKQENYNGKEFTAGAVESKFEIPGNSYVEVKAKVLDSKANVLSAIWLQSSPLVSSLDPNPEIDIMETFNFDQITSTLHTWNQKPNFHWQHAKNRWNTNIEDISKDFHLFGLERKNGKLRFFFDNQLIWEYRSSIGIDSFSELSRHMVFSLEGHLGYPNSGNLPRSFEIDYIRTYYNSSFGDLPEEGEYKIINRQSGKILEVPQGNKEDKTQLKQNSYVDKDNQKWLLGRNSDYTFTLTNKESNKVIDLKADTGVTKNGNPILQYTRNGQLNQSWYIVPTSDKYFKIVSALSGKVMCILNASNNDGANVVQWSYGNDNNDEWQFVRVK
ncbi:hypothetical protein IGI96_003742 [Enterococcus sp. DIV0421]|uniref:RICIN domain-containing protein n=1 Tax=Enterococcus sp. DIV0421 TaxID=2774688 RepID=UPI003F28B582